MPEPPARGHRQVHRRARGAGAQPEEIDVRFPLGRDDRGHRGIRLGKVDPRQRHPLPRARAGPARRDRATRHARAGRGALRDRQGHQHRPVPDRPHARGPTRRRTRTSSTRSASSVPHARGAGARVRPGPVLLQRQGGALRGLLRRRPDQDRDALPPRHLRHLRRLRRQAVQPRDPPGPLQGQVDRRHPGADRRAGARALRERPPGREHLPHARARWGSATSSSASPRRRSPAARRSASSSPASSRGGRPAGRSTCSTSRPPASTSTTSRSCSGVLRSLTEKGNTVIVIEHNLDVIRTADWVIDLGPEGGDAGGRIVAEGTPEAVAGVRGSFTGQFLKRSLGHTARRARA